MENKKGIEPKPIVCENCEKTISEVWPCEKCGTLICENCQAEYNQFTQIDYNCCKSCGER